MSIKKQNNLNKLLSTFMDSECADKAAEDFRQVDSIFDNYKSPQPNSKLISNIKADIQTELKHSKTSIIKISILRFAAVAAVFLIAVSLWLIQTPATSQKKQNQSVAKINTTSDQNIWDSEDVTTNDNQYETFEREIEQIESEIVAIKYETDSTINEESELSEIESDLIEIQSDFWKG